MCFGSKSMDDGDACPSPNPSSPPQRPVTELYKGLPNILVLGPMGGGVSTVVNLIAGKDIAKVSSDACRCTTKMACYETELKHAQDVVSVKLYEIPGFDHDAPSLLDLPPVPISLAIVCMQGVPNQVKAAVEYLKNQWGKHGVGSVPVLAVIIQTTPDPGWWDRNKMHFPIPGVVTGHVCLMKLAKDESTRKLQSLIVTNLPART